MSFDAWLNVILLAVIPLAMGFAGIYLAAKELESRKKKWGFIVFFAALAVFGITLAIAQQQRQAEREKRNEEAQQQLAAKLDVVKTQIGKILSSLTEGKALSGREVAPKRNEVARDEKLRRREILSLLRNEYILSHDNISAGMLAGLEMPPSEWVNRRLGQLKECWRVGANGISRYDKPCEPN